jgi:hypothetical protein
MFVREKHSGLLKLCVSYANGSAVNHHRGSCIIKLITVVIYARVFVAGNFKPRVVFVGKARSLP